MKCSIIKSLSQFYPISLLCIIANVQRSSFYAYLNKKKENTQDDELVKEVFFANNGKVGSRQISLQLKQHYGVVMNRKKIIKLMKKNHLVCSIRKKSPNSPKTTEEQYLKENILNKQFNAQAPLQTACTDITYLYFNNEVCYLCAYIDAKTGAILAHNLSQNLTKTFVLECSRNLFNKYPQIEMVHTDRGPQYTCKSFNDLLIENRVVHSMSRPGTPLDNSVMESFWGHMKDYLDLKLCNDFEDVVDLVHKYMLMYNNRPQWNKNKLSPLRYSELLLAA